MRRIAARNKVDVPAGVFTADGRFRWRDFLDFLTTYDAATSVIRTGEDYRDIVYEYLVACAAEGTIYVELTASADHAADVGLSDDEHLAALAQGIDDARDATGIEGRIVMSCVRHFGPEKAREVARRTVEAPHPYVTGFGMGGDEAGFPPEAFADAFAIAREAGLGLTVHAGEWAGPESVRGGLALGVSRIGHGVRASEDPELVRELADRGTVLEVCPTSNVVLGLYPSYEEHPLPALACRGGGGHARLGRPAVLGCVDRRRVRGRGRADGLRRRGAARGDADRAPCGVRRRRCPAAAARSGLGSRQLVPGPEEGFFREAHFDPLDARCPARSRRGRPRRLRRR